MSSIFLLLLIFQSSQAQVIKGTRLSTAHETFCEAGFQKSCEVSRNAKAAESGLRDYQRKHIRLGNRTSMRSRYVPDDLSDPERKITMARLELVPSTLTLDPAASSLMTPAQLDQFKHLEELREMLRSIPLNLYCEWDHDCWARSIGRNRCGTPMGYYTFSKIAGLPEIMAEVIKHDYHLNQLSGYFLETKICGDIQKPTPSCKSNVCTISP